MSPSWRSTCSPSRSWTAATSRWPFSKRSVARPSQLVPTCVSRKWVWPSSARCSFSSWPTIRFEWCNASARWARLPRRARLPPVRRRLRRAVLSCAGILLVLTSATTARAQEELLQELKRISSLRVEGRHRLSMGTLRRVMKTRGPSMWPWREVPLLRFDYLRSDTAAIAQLYRRYGYLDARAEYQVAVGSGNDNVAVTFHVHEGERSMVRQVQLPGIAAFTSRDLGRRLWARPGHPFDPAYLQLDTLRIAALYQEK